MFVNSTRSLFSSPFFKVIVVFEISYKSPDDEAGNFEPRHLIDPIQRQSDSIDDDQQKLLDIEQNIANLEKNLNRGTS